MRTKRAIHGFLVSTLALVWVLPLLANYVRVENVGLTAFDDVGKTVDVVFDLSWDNSWLGSENWDAAWVFVKFRAPGSNNWQHAELSTVSGNHTPAAGAVIDAVPDGKGVFVYAAGSVTGNVAYARTRLRWNYADNGYDFDAGDFIDVSVHAIEMVYAPQGGFHVGSGGTDANRFYRYTDGTQTTNTYQITSEDEIPVGTNHGDLYYTGQGDFLGPVSNAFPKGFSAFYAMKYPVTQGQYVSFLNKLTAAQWSTRNTGGNFGANRHTISGSTTNSVTISPDRACNYLSWMHLIAYLDWAALRPMSELEYEKLCRGPVDPVPNEYAWGTASKVLQTSHDETLGEDGSGRETALPANANYRAGSTTGFVGPVRVGIFATSNSPRVASGAGYYGAMHLTGNVYERVITIGSPLERNFVGGLGDGTLAANGNATIADWPSGGTDNLVGQRGGGSSVQSLHTTVSWRRRGGEGHAVRPHAWGGRGVRQAP